MARTGKLQSHDDLFRKKSASAANELQAAADETHGAMSAYISKLGKKRETLDIDMFVSAPREWNRFPALSPGKRLQLKMSIMNNGIIDPVIAWEQPDGKLMILAGHNRVQCCHEIISEYNDVELSRDYRSIPTIRYGASEINELKAREIIIDTNYIQRNDLPANLRAWVLKERIHLMRNQKDERGMSIGELIDELKIKKTAVYEDVKIATQVIDPLSALYFEGQISRKAVLRFSFFNEEQQRRIWDLYRDKLTTDRILSLSKNMKLWDQIAAVFEDDEVTGKASITLTIPKLYAPDIKSFSKLYVTDEAFRKVCDEYMARNYDSLATSDDRFT